MFFIFFAIFCRVSNTRMHKNHEKHEKTYFFVFFRDFSIWLIPFGLKWPIFRLAAETDRSAGILFTLNVQKSRGRSEFVFTKKSRKNLRFFLDTRQPLVIFRIFTTFLAVADEYAGAMQNAQCELVLGTGFLPFRRPPFFFEKRLPDGCSAY